jgi:hypothetical protein
MREIRTSNKGKGMKKYKKRRMMQIGWHPSGVYLINSGEKRREFVPNYDLYLSQIIDQSQRNRIFVQGILENWSMDILRKRRR